MSREKTVTAVFPDPKHILIVEDELLLRAMLGEMLREDGYIVVAACNADEAIVMLSTVTPDLIITDVRMPGTVDGIGLVAKVREIHRDLPVIVTSAHLTHFGDPGNARTHFVAKPYRFDSLIELINFELAN